MGFSYSGGKDHAVSLVLFGLPALLSLVATGVFSPSPGIELMFVGFLCLVRAKLPQIVAGDFTSFGVKNQKYLKTYLIGYALIGSGILLSLLYAGLHSAR